MAQAEVRFELKVPLKFFLAFLNLTVKSVSFFEG